MRTMETYKLNQNCADGVSYFEDVRPLIWSLLRELQPFQPPTLPTGQVCNHGGIRNIPTADRIKYNNRNQHTNMMDCVH